MTEATAAKTALPEEMDPDGAATEGAPAKRKRPPKPQTLKRPMRKRVKRYGKQLTRWVAG